MSYGEINIKGATGNAVPVIGTFWARLTVNGDDDYLHEVSEKVFSVGVVTGCPRPLVVGTSGTQSLGFGIFPGNPGYLAFVDGNNLGVNRGWGAQVKVEQLTPVPATDEGWEVMDREFWGSKRSTWAGGEGYTSCPQPNRYQIPYLDENTGNMCLSMAMEGNIITAVYFLDHISLPPGTTVMAKVSHGWISQVGGELGRG